MGKLKDHLINLEHKAQELKKKYGKERAASHLRRHHVPQDIIEKLLKGEL